jgi:ribose transport system substrate-binding protein
MGVVGLVASAGLLLAACGGGGDGGGSRTGTGSTTTLAVGTSTSVAAVPATTVPVASSTAPIAALSSEAGLADATARVAAYSNGPTSIGPVEPLTVPAPAPDIAYLQCPSPACADVATGVRNAARAIGGRALLVPYQANRASVDAALAYAAAAGPAMVLTGSLPRAWIAGALPNLAARGIPVVAWELPEGPAGAGIAANLITADDLWFRGVLLADQVVAATGGRARVVVWRLGDLVGSAGSAKVADGIRDELARVCPECSVDVRSYTVAQVQQGEHLVDFIEATTSGRPIDAVVSLQADLVLGGPDSLHLVQANLPGPAGGSDGATASPLRILTVDGSAEIYKLLIKGLHTADLAVPRAFLGWRAVDAGLRVLAGKSPLASGGSSAVSSATAAPFSGHPDIGAYGLPVQLLTAASFTKAATPRQSPWKSWPGVQGFDGLFRTLWGIGS